MLAYYPFNGNANDESGNGNNGTVNGATLTTDRFGNVDAAYDFDGNSYIQSSGNNLPDGERTVSLWLYSNNIGSGPLGRSVLGYGIGSSGPPFSGAWVMTLDNNVSEDGRK